LCKALCKNARLNYKHLQCPPRYVLDTYAPILARITRTLHTYTRTHTYTHYAYMHAHAGSRGPSNAAPGVASISSEERKEIGVLFTVIQIRQKAECACACVILCVYF
jgi:hypothetical protein